MGAAGGAPCDPTTWPGSVQREVIRHTIAPDVSVDPGPFPAFPYCAAVFMVKDEADIIRANLAWLYHTGVRRFVVLDNGSTDGTGAELARFRQDRPDAQLLVWHDSTIAYYQAENTTALIQRARVAWPDIEWVLPVDADEFCIARHGMRALAIVPESVMALTIPKVIHFLREGSQDRAGIAPLAQMNVRSAMFVVPPKVILRARAQLGVDQGNHRAVSADASRIVYAGGFQYGFFHREFQTRSFAHFLRKIRNGGQAILAAQAAGRAVGGDHWLAAYRVLMEHGEAGLRATFDTDCVRLPGGQYVTDEWLPDV